MSNFVSKFFADTFDDRTILAGKDRIKIIERDRCWSSVRARRHRILVSNTRTPSSQLQCKALLCAIAVN